MIKNFGPYKLVDFNPNLSQKKKDEFRANFYSKIIITIILIALFLLPAPGLLYAIKLNVNKNKLPAAITLSKIYLALYPKTEYIYDMRAYAKYIKHDYEGALKDYKTALELSGKNFSKKDFVRFVKFTVTGKEIKYTGKCC